MSLPLPSQAFVRMADVSPASANIRGLLDAIYTALGAVVDYRGTAVPVANRWTVARYQNVGVTECVYLTAPAGTAMGLNPMILIAGAAAGAPTMAAPDVFVASAVQLGIVKNAGAFNAWTNAAPATSGTFSGYWRAAGTTWNAVTATVRCYVAPEQIFIQLINAAGTGMAWMSAGAILEPFTSFAASGGSTAESDDRLYGMWSTGNASMATDWLNLNNTLTPFGYGALDGNTHGMVFQPGAAVLYTMGRATMPGGLASSSIDSAGAFIGIPFAAGRVSAANTYQGARLGMYRGFSTAGQIQSGRTIRSGGTDLYHVVSSSNVGADDAMFLAASP